jgi:hypothetical protein
MAPRFPTWRVVLKCRLWAVSVAAGGCRYIARNPPSPSAPSFLLSASALVLPRVPAVSALFIPALMPFMGKESGQTNGGSVQEHSELGKCAIFRHASCNVEKGR